MSIRTQVRNFIVPLIFGVVVAAITAQSVAANLLFPRDQVLADLKQTETLLKRYHPNLYAHRNAKKLRILFKQVRSEVEDWQTLSRTALQVQRMMAAVCDEHTALNWPAMFKMLGQTSHAILAAPIILHGEKAFMKSDIEARNGLTIDRFDKIPAADVARRIAASLHADGCVGNQPYSSRGLEPIFGLVLADMVSLGQSIEIPRVDGEGKIQKTETITRQDILSFKGLEYEGRVGRISQLNRLGIPSWVGGDWDGRYSGVPRTIVRSSKDGKIWYVRVPTFLGRKDWQKNLGKEMRKLIASKPEVVILDLSENKGGRVIDASYLSSFFLKTAHRVAHTIRIKTLRSPKKDGVVWDRKDADTANSDMRRQFRRARRGKKLRPLRFRAKSWGNPSFNGKLVVLVSPSTKSAATMVTHVLQRKRDVTVVGYQPQSSVKTTCYGLGGHFALKHTRIPISLPYACIDRFPAKNRKATQLVPDIEVSPLDSTGFGYLTDIMTAAVDHILASRE